MNTFYAPKPFPAAELPPIIRAAVDELYQYIQVPYPLAVSAVLSAASLACQWHYSLNSDYYGVCPIKLPNGKLRWPADALEQLMGASK